MGISFSFRVKERNKRQSSNCTRHRSISIQNTDIKRVWYCFILIPMGTWRSDITTLIKIVCADKITWAFSRKQFSASSHPCSCPIYTRDIYLIIESSAIWCRGNATTTSIRCIGKFPDYIKKRNTGLTYSILAAISFKIVSLGTYTAMPQFFPSFKSTVQVIFLNAVEYRLRFPLDVRQFQNVVPPVSLSICETKRNHRWLSPASREDGNDNHVVVSHKFCGFRGRVGGALSWWSNAAHVHMFC
jgi:hypothetical protein